MSDQFPEGAHPDEAAAQRPEDPASISEPFAEPYPARRVSIFGVWRHSLLAILGAAVLLLAVCAAVIWMFQTIDDIRKDVVKKDPATPHRETPETQPPVPPSVDTSVRAVNEHSITSDGRSKQDSPTPTGRGTSTTAFPERGGSSLASSRINVQRQRELAAQRAAARAKIVRAYHQGQQVRALMDQLEEEVTLWDAQVKPLLTDERGKKIAASQTHLAQFQALYEKQRTAPAEIAGMREELQVLLEPIGLAYKAEEAADDAVVVLGDDIGRIRGEIEKAIREYQPDRRTVETWLEDLEDQETADVLALGESLKALTQEQDRERARRLEVDRREVAEAGEQLVRQAKAEKTLEEKEQEAIQVRASTSDLAKENDDLRTLIDKTIADWKKQKDYETLRAEALAPEVLSVLAPVITPGKSQPRDILGMGALGEVTPDAKPVSLMKLRSLGVLDRTQRGMSRVAQLNSGGWTDRPRWRMAYEATEPSLWTAQQKTMITQFQDYLIKYGEVLVKEGKLEP